MGSFNPTTSNSAALAGTTMFRPQPDCVCDNRDNINFDSHHLPHTQQKEEFLLAQYSYFEEVLQAEYLNISRSLLDEVEGTYEADVLEGVLDQLRDMMAYQEYCLGFARSELWARYHEEEGIVVGGGKVKVEVEREERARSVVGT